MSSLETTYTQQLINNANVFLSENDYERILREILVPSNNFRSGWTESVSRIFHEPANAQERALANQLVEIIIKTVAGLLDTAEASSEIFAYAKLEYIATFLHRLGKHAPQHLVQETKSLLQESQALGAPDFGLITVPALTLLSELDLD